MSFLYFALVMSILILSSEHWLNLLNSLRGFSIDNKTFRIKVRSSANMLSFIILLLILMPFMFSSDRI